MSRPRAASRRRAGRRPRRPIPGYGPSYFDHRGAQHPDPLPFAFDHVAVLERPFRIHELAAAPRRAGEDHVAGLEREAVRAEADQLGDPEDHLRGVRVLDELAVDLRRELEALRVLDLDE